MSKRKGTHLQRYRQPGGGVAVQQSRHDEHGVVTIGLDLSNAPVPDRRYVADVASVIVSDDIVHLLFGQAQVVGKQLRTLLDIHVPAIGIRNFVGSMQNQSMSETLSVLRTKLGFEGRGLYELKEEPKETFSLAVNFIAMAITAREACLDMYYADTFALSKAIRGAGQITADPVVRISLPSAVLLALIAKLETVRDTLPENI